MHSYSRDFYTLYNIEAIEFDAKNRQASFWKILLQASGIFIAITLIVFCIANYPFIKSQYAQWRSKLEEDLFVRDTNKNDLPDWWEQQYGLNMTGQRTQFLDSDEDLANNLTEYAFGTNPIEPDTDRDGYFDGEELKKGYDPNGIGRLDRDRDGIADWWEEKHGLSSNRKEDASLDWDSDGLTNLEEAQHLTDPHMTDSDQDGTPDGQEVALGTNPMGEGAIEPEVTNKSDRDNDNLDDFWENLYGTNPAKSDTDGDGYQDFHELARGYDPTVATAGEEGRYKAELVIPKIDVKAPIVWSQKESTLVKDLEQGIIHYPATAFPGTRGNVYLSGHSSYFAWSKSPYKEILKRLGEVNDDDTVIVRISLRNGREIDVTYRIRSTKVVVADDPMLLRGFEGYEMTLVTCWPVGTDWKRLMVKAELDSPRP